MIPLLDLAIPVDRPTHVIGRSTRSTTDWFSFPSQASMFVPPPSFWVSAHRLKTCRQKTGQAKQTLFLLALATTPVCWDTLLGSNYYPGGRGPARRALPGRKIGLPVHSPQIVELPPPISLFDQISRLRHLRNPSRVRGILDHGRQPAVDGDTEAMKTYNESLRACGAGVQYGRSQAPANPFRSPGHTTLSRETTGAI
jgi:hypothetical protein